MKLSAKSWLVGGATGFALVIGMFAPLQAQSQYRSSLENRVEVLEQQVSILNQRITNVERGTPGGSSDSIRRPFTGIGETWRIKTINGLGGNMELANNTKWTIADPDIPMVGKWKLGEIIEIRTNNNKNYPYLLINTDRRQQVAAQYQGTR